MAKFNELIQQDKPVLIDFFATWCGPCQTLQPILKDIKDTMGDSVSVIKIDVDKNQLLAQKFQIRGVPTLMIYRNGQQIWKGSGVYPKSELMELLKKAQKS
jgi:thioredoxin 1